MDTNTFKNDYLLHIYHKIYKNEIQFNVTSDNNSNSKEVENKKQ